MRVVVTGSQGQIGAAVVGALSAAGHEVTATDLGAVDPHTYDGPPYLRADLTDAGAAWAVVRDHDVVVHAAAIPTPEHHPPHVLFHNNVMAGFNVVEACTRSDVRRLVNVSSETVAGFIFEAQHVHPDEVPFDERSAPRPRDPYGFGKLVIEQWCDVAAGARGLDVVTIRPSWVQTPQTYQRNLGPYHADPTMPSDGYWSYVDVDDLADLIVLAVEADGSGHEVVYAAQPDNFMGRPLADLVATVYPDAGIRVRDDLPRADAPGLDSSRARERFGWEPTRSWRDHLG